MQSGRNDVCNGSVRQGNTFVICFCVGPVGGAQVQQEIDINQKGHRIVRKTAPFYSCKHCNSKMTGLWREFGRWPIAEWTELNEEEKTNFFKDCSNKGTYLRRTLSHMLDRKRIEIKKGFCESKFLPLSVYGKQGFDVDLIANNSSDADKRLDKVPRLI